MEISYHSESGKNYTISADGEKIQQVIANILDNSIKYTAQGRIDVSLSSTDKYIIIEISDTGSRIVPAISPNLSKKFARSGDENEAAIIGNGLGLYVAKRLIEAHQGSIKIEQDVSNGIWKFTIELPKA